MSDSRRRTGVRTARRRTSRSGSSTAFPGGSSRTVCFRPSGRRGWALPAPQTTGESAICSSRGRCRQWDGRVCAPDRCGVVGHEYDNEWWVVDSNCSAPATVLRRDGRVAIACFRGCSCCLPGGSLSRLSRLCRRRCSCCCMIRWPGCVPEHRRL